MACLIQELQVRDMQTEEIGCFLNLSPSGARKYATFLREAGIIEISHYLAALRRPYPAVYRLACDHTLTRQLIASLWSRSSKAASARNPKFSRDLSENSRIHVLADDVPFHIRRSKVVVQRDPLVSALFGSAC
jgi:hypothetical protein